MENKKTWTKEDLERAHNFSANNRPELKKDSRCGCFNCLHIYDPAEIKEWIVDPNSPIDHLGTAICPYCKRDTVLGESSGFPIETPFLEAMNNQYISAKMFIPLSWILGLKQNDPD